MIQELLKDNLLTVPNGFSTDALHGAPVLALVSLG